MRRKGFKPGRLGLRMLSFARQRIYRYTGEYELPPLPEVPTYWQPEAPSQESAIRSAERAPQSPEVIARTPARTPRPAAPASAPAPTPAPTPTPTLARTPTPTPAPRREETPAFSQPPRRDTIAPDLLRILEGHEQVAQEQGEVESPPPAKPAAVRPPVAPEIQRSARGTGRVEEIKPKQPANDYEMETWEDEAEVWETEMLPTSYLDELPQPKPYTLRTDTEEPGAPPSLLESYAAVESSRPKSTADARVQRQIETSAETPPTQAPLLPARSSRREIARQVEAFDAPDAVEEETPPIARKRSAPVQDIHPQGSEIADVPEVQDFQEDSGEAEWIEPALAEQQSEAEVIEEAQAYVPPLETPVQPEARAKPADTVRRSPSAPSKNVELMSSLSKTPEQPPADFTLPTLDDEVDRDTDRVDYNSGAASNFLSPFHRDDFEPGVPNPVQRKSRIQERPTPVQREEFYPPEPAFEFEPPYSESEDAGDEQPPHLFEALMETGMVQARHEPPPDIARKRSKRAERTITPEPSYESDNDDEYAAEIPDADSVEADLLQLLNMPPDTPVVGLKPRSAANSQSVQREVATDEIVPANPNAPARRSQSTPPPPASTSTYTVAREEEAAPPAQPAQTTTDGNESAENGRSQNNGANIDKLAREVYRLLRGKLRIEQERRTDK